MVEDERAAPRIGGEPTEPVPADQAPARFDGTPIDADYHEPVEAPVTPVSEYDPAADPETAPETGPGVAGQPGRPGTPEPPRPFEQAEHSGPPGEPERPEQPEQPEQPDAGRRRGLRRAKVPA